MIFDIGWIEILVVAVIAIIVVGPKDLPRMMRIVGQWVGKARGLAREFQKSLDDLMRESELEDLRKEVDELRKMNPMEDVKKALDPTDELRQLDKDIKSDLEATSNEMKALKEASPPQSEKIKADLSAEQEKVEDARTDRRNDNMDASGETGGVEP
jgi:sec-independent protein translocase protein TatB